MVILAYLIGAIPFGYISVKWRTGEDIRTLHSGRTGGTNAMRSIGYGLGLLSGILDGFKGAVPIWIAKEFFPEMPWLLAVCGLAAIIGHNYSIFMLKQDVNGKWKFYGGAGGAPTLGASAGIWFPCLYIILPIGVAVFYFVGYASVTTMSIGGIALIIFLIRAWFLGQPWAYVGYAIGAVLLLMWALRPNIKRLINGTEGLQGLRAKKSKTSTKKQE